MLFLLGVGLLALEILVIPGFGVPGIAGVGLILVSLYMASVKYGLPSPDRPWELEGFLDEFQNITVTVTWGEDTGEQTVMRSEEVAVRRTGSL